MRDTPRRTAASNEDGALPERPEPSARFGRHPLVIELQLFFVSDSHSTVSTDFGARAAERLSFACSATAELAALRRALSLDEAKSTPDRLWLPAHCGTRGYEEADRLAALAQRDDACPTSSVAAFSDARLLHVYALPSSDEFCEVLSIMSGILEDKPPTLEELCLCLKLPIPRRPLEADFKIEYCEWVPEADRDRVTQLLKSEVSRLPRRKHHVTSDSPATGEPEDCSSFDEGGHGRRDSEAQDVMLYLQSDDKDVKDVLK
ncbi:hypothetical protein HPB47_020678 [Ixodes persulcatus]|uniref:Uncharacterized protein n=1 Tax=Ixodes persulcatus TaxID=34615 RepID=A0AC60QF34_IXOPE|nr:hypothetical protein HPB47_020678 [Ixodes persulcatus]